MPDFLDQVLLCCTGTAVLSCSVHVSSAVACFGLLVPAEPCHSMVKVARAADILASSSVYGNIMIFTEAQNCSGYFKGLGCADQNMMNSSRKFK